MSNEELFDSVQRYFKRAQQAIKDAEFQMAYASFKLSELLGCWDALIAAVAENTQGGQCDEVRKSV